MRVGQENRGARGADASEFEPELGRVTARIDDDCRRRRSVGAHDIAVRPDRPELMAVDGKWHGSLTSSR
jgi:hypothetical protein